MLAGRGPFARVRGAAKGGIRPEHQIEIDRDHDQAKAGHDMDVQGCVGEAAEVHEQRPEAGERKQHDRVPDPDEELG